MYLDMSLQLNAFIQALDEPQKTIVSIIVYVILPILCFSYIVWNDIKAEA